MVLELIGGVFDENLRTELIRRSGEADYDGLLKIAQNWHTSDITIKGIASERTDETARKAISTYNQRQAEDWNERYKVQAPANQQRNVAPGENNRPVCRNCDSKHQRGE